MKTWAKFHELPLAGIEPEGWLREYLEKQRNGLTGHIEVAGPPFNTEGWCSKELIRKDNTHWVPYEQTGYWVDGALRCGHLLRDPWLIEKAARQVEHILNNPDTDGFLGLPALKESEHWNRWAHVVFFRALMAHYSATGDKRIVQALQKHYLGGKHNHAFGRNVCNVEIILWTYEKTGDSRLLDLALDAYAAYNRQQPDADTSLATMLSDKKGTEHGVTYNEIAKLGAILYMTTGKQKFLDATVNAYRKLDRDQMLIAGVHSSSEHLEGKNPLDSYETCDIADFTWSAGYLLMATARVEYADKIERACFNAAPGAVKSDFKALQYFSCANQVVASANSNHNLFFRGEKWMSFRPNPGTQCCPGELNRIMPNYAARMWMTDNKAGLVAALYGPSRITARVGNELREVTIIQETNYPFSEEINFIIHSSKDVKFPLVLRIPGWCKDASLAINGKKLATTCKAGTFVTLNRTFRPGDRVTLTLPMTLKTSQWAHGGIGIERGPLVYALRIEENWEVDKNEVNQSKEFPAWNLKAASPWNYALCLDGKKLEDVIKVIHRDPSNDSWTLDGAPIELHVPARRIHNWKLEHPRTVESHIYLDGVIQIDEESKGRTGDFEFTPQLPDSKTLSQGLNKRTETVRLIPYGCTHLRIAIFPHI